MKKLLLTEKLDMEMRRQILENSVNPVTYGDYSALMLQCMDAVGYAEGTKRNYTHINTKFINPRIECSVLPDIPSTELTWITDAMYREHLSYYYRRIAKDVFVKNTTNLLSTSSVSALFIEKVFNSPDFKKDNNLSFLFRSLLKLFALGNILFVYMDQSDNHTGYFFNRMMESLRDKSEDRT